MEITHIIIRVIEVVVFLLSSFAVSYILVFGIAALFPYHNRKPSEQTLRRFAVMIPGYKEDAVIVGVAQDVLHQNYPKEYFDVIVIADSFKPETLNALRQLPITLIEVKFDISKKSKALNTAMKVLGDEYDVAMILDADNIINPDVIELLNQSFDNGFVAVQGHRLAKNLNTSFAILDAISEEINNNLFRKGHRVLGFSAALIGSGMALDYKLFKSVMATIDSVGEDKEVEMKLLEAGHKIDYVHHAYVFDEKTQQPQAFVNQRRRWLAAQFIYFRQYFFSGAKQLILKGNYDFFDKVLQMIQPPRILLAGSLLIYFFISVIIHTLSQDIVLLFPAWSWLLLFGITAFVLLINTPRKFYNRNLFKAILSLPKGFALMLWSLLRIKGAGQRFIHTQHTHIDPVMKRSK